MGPLIRQWDEPSEEGMSLIWPEPQTPMRETRRIMVYTIGW